MPSRISCFNQTLYRKNLSRFWPLWVMASFVGSLAPLAILVRLMQAHFTYTLTPASVARELYKALTCAAPVILLIYCALCALAVWSFLYNSRSVGLLHALPITRKGIFLTNFLSGMTMVLAPFVVIGILSVPVTALAGGFDLKAFAVTALGVLGMALFYYASATAAVFITGNIFAMPVLYGIFHFLAVIVDFLFSTLANGFFFGYEDGYAGAVEYLSPTVYMMRRLDVHETYETVTKPLQNGQLWTTQVLTSASLRRGWIIAAYALVGVVLLGAAWLLYRRRRSESAGDVVAVGWMKPVFRYGVALCSALGGGQLLYLFFWSSYQNGSLYDLLPLMICTAVAGLIGYYGASMLLSKSLRVFHRRSALGAVCVAAACVVVCLSFRADLFGVERRIPAVEDVKSLDFYVSGDNWCDGTVTDPETVAAFQKVQQAVLAEKETFLQNERTSNPDVDTDSEFAQIQVAYSLKNGKEILRRYDLYYTQDQLDDPAGAMGLLKKLVTDPAVQRANLLYNDKKIAAFTGGTMVRCDSKTGMLIHRQLSAQEAQALYEAVVRDVDAGHFGQTFFQGDQWAEETYYGDLEFWYQIKQKYQGSDYPQSLSTSFSVHCTEVLQTLRDLGLINDQYRLMTYQEFQNTRSDDDVYDDEMIYDQGFAQETAGTDTVVIAR